mmetsp:Transcript_47984/g.102757  ORF Transcript_47984/g.102757 Transcript_47984/m.102757 type:complete len:139 (+) Transcript_47984:92-508(+)
MGCSTSRSSVLLQASPLKVAADVEAQEAVPRQPTLLRGTSNGVLLSGPSLEDDAPKLPMHKSAPAALGKRTGGLVAAKKTRNSSKNHKRSAARRVTFGEVQTRQFRVELYGLQMEAPDDVDACRLAEKAAMQEVGQRI